MMWDFERDKFWNETSDVNLDDQERPFQCPILTPEETISQLKGTQQGYEEKDFAENLKSSIEKHKCEYCGHFFKSSKALGNCYSSLYLCFLGGHMSHHSPRFLNKKIRKNNIVEKRRIKYLNRGRTDSVTNDPF